MYDMNDFNKIKNKKVTNKQTNTFAIEISIHTFSNAFLYTNIMKLSTIEVLPLYV